MSREYDLYLEQHKNNIVKGFNWIRKNSPELLIPIPGVDYEHQICFAHDVSKTESDEYEAYDAYFYGGNRSYEVCQNFNHAWLKHIHRNPHHWQHWILHNDEPDEDINLLDMPWNYTIEMICDWWAFSWVNGNLYEIFDWYEQHKDYIKFSIYTRSSVENILDNIRRKLDEIGGGTDGQLV